jgi:esterase/lipase/1-acyl-sn-glycerol-3-phosphate acyltransferase
MGSFAFKSTKWTLDIATKLIKANIRLHNVENIRDDLAIIFVVNHFTRLETVLLPYILNQQTGKEIWSLAAAELFVGRIGKYLLSTGNVSTKDPDRDRTIVCSLLNGENPWIIFPEGGMIKDKKVVDAQGMFTIYSEGTRRSPHTGAATLALRAEFYRQRLALLKDDPDRQQELTNVLERFCVVSLDKVLEQHTAIIPVNVTYFPIRAHENIVLRVARGVAKDLSRRALEELSVEGTVLSKDTDIDVTFGEPIDVREYLEVPELSRLKATPGEELTPQEDDPKSTFNEAARRLMIRYMAEIYRNTTVNYDHIFGTIIRHQRARKFTERAYRNRIFLCVHQIKLLGQHRLHHVLDQSYRDIIYEDPSKAFNDFVELCINDGILRRQGDFYIKNFQLRPGRGNFQTVRKDELTTVIANEVEPLSLLTNLIRNVAHTPRTVLSTKIRSIFLQEDLAVFEKDYATHAVPGESKPPEVGRPFLLMPKRFKAGVLLIHGYLAAPEEVRAMAGHFEANGYAVYAARLRGHGTSPEDLAQTPWEEWYESVNRGYAIIKSLTDNIIIGGFSTGGVLALLAAGKKGNKIKAVFAINAPLQLRNYMARFASSIVSMNSLLARLKGGSSWDYVENAPENEHINYTRNPVTGVKELGEAMRAMEDVLGNVCVPTLLIQSHRDPTVDPISAAAIYERLGTVEKELTYFNHDRHGIVNGQGSEEVFDRVDRFLMWANERDISTRTASQSEEDEQESEVEAG